MSSRPFRGSRAVAAGTVTGAELRGPRFRRLFTDVYVSAEVEVDLALRSRAAQLRVGGVLGGWSAAEVLGASCGPQTAAAEVIVAGGGRRTRPGLVVRGDVLAADEITTVGGALVTTPVRTAWDLARRAPPEDAVVAVDALTRVFGFPPRAVITFGYRHLGARGSAQLPAVVALANPLAESPMESRIRVAIHRDGLPIPVLQHQVGRYRLDMAYPRIRLGIEYDGRQHLTPDRALRDLERQAWLSTAGWTVLRFRAYDVLSRPRWVAAQVRAALAR